MVKEKEEEESGMREGKIRESWLGSSLGCLGKANAAGQRGWMGVGIKIRRSLLVF